MRSLLSTFLNAIYKSLMPCTGLATGRRQLKHSIEIHQIVQTSDQQLRLAYIYIYGNPYPYLFSSSTGNHIRSQYAIYIYIYIYIYHNAIMTVAMAQTVAALSC